MTMVSTLFLAAASVYSPSFFWMWNAPIDVDRYCAQLDEMAAKGVMSLCIHPVPKEFRPDIFATSMAPAYMSDDYLSRYEKIVRHAAKLGMHSYLYDEGGWPSGGACGLVMKADKEGRFRHRGLLPTADGGYEEVVKPYGDGKLNYPSPLEKGMAEKFIELTHERIKGVLGDEFGKAIQIAFMDEPGYDTWHYKGGIPWCSDFAEEFQRRKGYDLKPYLARLVKFRNEAEGDLQEKWQDYHAVLSDLFVERFVLPIRAWCRANGLKSGGHFSGEHKTDGYYRTNFGSILKDLRALDAPGVDVIWRQLHPLTWPSEKIFAAFPRFATSAAHYNGGNLVICELGAIFGNSLTPTELRWLTNYCLVRGNNLFVYAYHPVSSAGAWQLLFEPHHGPVNPQWDLQCPFFTGLHRLAEELARGKSAVETVVFFDNRAFVSTGAKSTIASSAMEAAANALDERHCDYDFADEEMLLGGRIEAGTLCCGEMRYTTVVVPAKGMMSDNTAALLERFRAAGGKVLGIDELDQVKPICKVEGVLAEDIRATKRYVDGKTYIFLVNECVDESFDLVLDLGVEGPLAVMDPVTGELQSVAHEHGKFKWKFANAGSSLFVVGVQGTKPAKVLYPPKRGEGMALKAGWTIQPLCQWVSEQDDFKVKSLNADPVALAALGDWRAQLGAYFSGKVKYVNRFQAKKGCRLLDLGKVAFAATVKLNGKELAPKYVGPYRWEVELREGENVLEVTVVNQLSVMMSDENWRNDIQSRYVIHAEYEKRMRVYDHSNSDSGLFGPVTLY